MIKRRKRMEQDVLAEVYERKTFHIEAKSKLLAEKTVKKMLQSQDKFISVRSTSPGYEAIIMKFIGREVE
jgi:hypothetical protein